MSTTTAQPVHVDPYAAVRPVTLRPFLAAALNAARPHLEAAVTAAVRAVLDQATGAASGTD